MIIKSIRIKNFRSLVDETIDLSDMNFFVGKNDSGKSNVLKALNLFFNKETDFGMPFDFYADYSKFAKKVIKHAKEITISLNIVIPDSFQETGVKTWTKVWREEGLHSDNIDEIFKRGSKGSTFLNRIQYMYIPAVKSNEYFKYLLSQLYLSMTKTANSALKDLNEQYSEQLQALTSGLSHQLKNVLNLQSAIQMPEDLNVLFRDLTFRTSDTLVQGVDLNRRGDGVKARHIPSILRYMQNNIEKYKLKGAISNSFIWGYEEPENGVEYLSCFEMADELHSYCNTCQMLVTTHSPAFYMKSNTNNSKCFYVYKCSAGSSKYETDITATDIDEKIGFLPLVAPYINDERLKYLEKEKVLNDEIKTISKKYEQIKGKMAVDKKFGFAEYEYAKTQGKLTPEVKLDYLQRAADHGCGQAEYAIGKIFYERGQVDDALYYFEKAGRRDSMARTHLGLLYCYSLDDWNRGMMLLRSASDEGYAPATEAIRAIEKNLDARIIVGVCDLFYYASNILEESGEDYYSHDHSDGVDIRIKKEDRAKRMGITMSGF